MAMSRAIYMRRIKKRGKSVYLSGDDPSNVYIVMDGIAIQDSSLSTSTSTSSSRDCGTILGPGRAFGLVSPLTIEEPRYDSVFNDVFPWEIKNRMSDSRLLLNTDNIDSSNDKTKTNVPLLLAVIPLSTFFEEAAPGLSKRAESYRPYVCLHLSPSVSWLDSKHFVFARQLRTRSFMPGDVVWRRGQPADSVAVIVDGNFVITREVAWNVCNMWPEDADKTSNNRRCRIREDGTTMVLETISNVFGNGDASSPSSNSSSAGRGGEGEGHVKGKKKLTSQSKIGEVNECVEDINVIVGEEPLLLVKEDPNGIKHSFIETRRYTLRASGPGICTLIELPRNAVRRYLPFRGEWTKSILNQANSRLISDESVALAHRQRIAFEVASRKEWGCKMTAREKEYKMKQQWSDQGSSCNDSGHLLAHTNKVFKDEWKDKAKALRKIPRSHQGQWGKTLHVPLPMLVAGVQGIQRG